VYTRVHTPRFCGDAASAGTQQIAIRHWQFAFSREELYPCHGQGS